MWCSGGMARYGAIHLPHHIKHLQRDHHNIHVQLHSGDVYDKALSVEAILNLPRYRVRFHIIIVSIIDSSFWRSEITGLIKVSNSQRLKVTKNQLISKYIMVNACVPTPTLRFYVQSLMKRDCIEEGYFTPLYTEKIKTIYYGQYL